MKSSGFSILCLFCSVMCTLAEEEELKPSESIFTYRNGQYGLSLANKLNWFEAQQACASEGFVLVSIPTEIVKRQVYSFIKSAVGHKWSLIANDPIWTSGTNLGSTDQYVWHSIGTALSYRNFLEPPEKTHSCIGLNGVTGYWSTVNCRDQNYFICELKCKE